MININDCGFLNKRFSTLALICVVTHFIIGTVLTGFAVPLMTSEMEKFSCAVDTTFATIKTYAEKTCFSMYNDTYNSPIRFWIFVLLSFGSVVLVSVIYFLGVQSRIDEIERYLTKHNEAQTGDTIPGRNTLYIFKFYRLQLVVRSMLGLLFACLQYNVLYPNSFVSHFRCEYVNLSQENLNATSSNNGNATLSSVTCTHSGAEDKQLLAKIVLAYNIIFTIITLAEFVHLILCQYQRFNILSCLYTEPKTVPWSCDSHFIIEYFLGKPYEPHYVELTRVEYPSAEVECYKNYIVEILSKVGNSDVNFGSDMFIELVIQTGRVSNKFRKNMGRHEIYDVYMTFPEDSIRFKKIEDLFQPNQDTKNQSPRTILVVGRPGIGKTVLTEKIMYDWAKGDAFFKDKLVFLAKFRCFTFDEYQKLTLKEFLRFGTNLNKEEFEDIFKTHSPKQIIIIFDGLDEFCSNHNDYQRYVDQSHAYDNDPSISMTAMLLFIKIIGGSLLEGATILVTSRPTVSDVYNMMNFDREVEIIGFTSDKIKKYVERFCITNNNPHSNETIWNHIESSSEIKNLCYIPVNCYIICATLSFILCDSTTNSPLPATLTELYDVASIHFHENHCPLAKRNEECTCIKQLQMLAFGEMKKDNLVFKGELVNKQIKESGLLHCLPVPFPRTPRQFCFLHLTMQEFLAAMHIIETKQTEEIKEFISSHFHDGKWHLVLQFLAGLLGKKMKDSDEQHKEFRSCVLVFIKYSKCRTRDEGVELSLTLSDVLAMKCLRETEDESIVKETATTSVLKNVTKMKIGYESLLSASDLETIALVCQHLNSLTGLDLYHIDHSECVKSIIKIVEGKCIKSLDFTVCECGDYFVKHLSSASLKLQHFKLTKLRLHRCKIADTGVLHLAHFLRNGQGSCLETLNLRSNEITQCGMTTLSKVLEEGVCDQLRELYIGGNDIGDEGVEYLCKALVRVQSKLTWLSLYRCSLTSECISWIANVLSDENCEITNLSLAHNYIRDEGVRVLCPAMMTGNCKLKYLDLFKCSLTHECTTALFEALACGFCGLKKLELQNNKIGDRGVAMLCCALRKKECTLTELGIRNCSLTDECLPSLGAAVTEEVCGLRELNLRYNVLTDKYLSLLSRAVRNEHWCLKYLVFPKEHLTEEGKVVLEDIEIYLNNMS